MNSSVVIPWNIQKLYQGFVWLMKLACIFFLFPHTHIYTHMHSSMTALGIFVWVVTKLYKKKKKKKKKKNNNNNNKSMD